MCIISPQKIAGENLRKLIQDNFPSQQAFAYEYGIEIRTVSRYINEGINRIDVVQSLAEFFKVDFEDFFKKEKKQ